MGQTFLSQIPPQQHSTLLGHSTAVQREIRPRKNVLVPAQTLVGQPPRMSQDCDKNQHSVFENPLSFQSQKSTWKSGKLQNGPTPCSFSLPRAGPGSTPRTASKCMPPCAYPPINHPLTFPSIHRKPQVPTPERKNVYTTFSWYITI